MEILSSETSVHMLTTRCYIPEDGNLHVQYNLTNPRNLNKKEKKIIYYETSYLSSNIQLRNVDTNITQKQMR
jgi:hypothetical protein